MLVVLTVLEHGPLKIHSTLTFVLQNACISITTTTIRTCGCKFVLKLLEIIDFGRQVTVQTFETILSIAVIMLLVSEKSEGRLI